MNEKICILIQISLKFVPKGPIHYKPALVQIMAWCQTGDNTDPIHWRYYAVLGGNELTPSRIDHIFEFFPELNQYTVTHSKHR